MLTLPGVETDVFSWPPTQRIQLKSGLDVTVVRNLVLTLPALYAMRDRLMYSERLYFDTEGSGLHPHLGARTCGYALGVQTARDVFEAWYVPIRHLATHIEQLPKRDVFAVIAELLARPLATVVGHNLKFDAGIIRADGILITSQWEDTAIQANINDENEISFALKRLAARYGHAAAQSEEGELDDWMRRDAKRLGMRYGKTKQHRDDQEPTYLERFGYSRSPIYLCGRYACMDVFWTWVLDSYYTPRIAQYREVHAREIAISHHIHEMEWDGLKVNADIIHKADEDVKADVAFYLKRLKELVGDPSFEPNAPQLRALLFNKLKMTPPKVTKKSKMSAVDAEAMGILAQQYPQHKELFKMISGYAKMEKIRSTYTAAFLRHVTPAGRIHSKYNQLEEKDEGGVPVTGRLSSADPNTQNIAKKSYHLLSCCCKKCNPVAPGPERTVSVRRYYVVEPGYVRAYIDLSQIELRVLAWFSRDPRLLYCYAHDLDVHQITADEVTGGDRSIAKQVNFGNNYGMTEIGLAKRIPYYSQDPARALRDAEMYLEKFFQVYAGIPVFKNKLANEMRRNNGMFVSPFGRPRRIPTIASSDRQERARAERMMMSSIISGTSADLMKEILLRCGVMLAAEHTTTKIVQTIHDEVVFDIPIQGCTTVLPKLMKIFTDWPMFEEQGVPIRASCELSTTDWETKRAIEITPEGFRWAA